MSKSKDPFYVKEKLNYEFPIPSREWILQILEEYGRPMTRQKLLNLLEVKSEEEQKSLGFRLKAMMRDGQLMQDRRGRFCLLKRINLKRGRVQGHPDGFGFFIPDDADGDMLLAPVEMRGVMDGDIVLAYQTGVDRRGRPEGKVHEVIEHANTTVVGRFFIEHGIAVVSPDNKRLTQDISIPLDAIGSAQNGQIVLAEVVVFPGRRNQAVGRILQVLGEHMAPGMEIEVAIHSHGIPAVWPQDVEKALDKVPSVVLEKDTEGRTDLRHLPFVTIDGADARDFDDAVYCEIKPKGGFRLMVAIADVSHYVKPGSALDKEAARRGNSVYFPGQVVPMLPEILSNGICSLNPLVDRLAIVADLAISADGKIMRHRFYRAVFCSKARLTYTEVGQWLAHGAVNDADKAHLWPMISNLYTLYSVLQGARKTRGAMDFDTIETAIEFDEQRKIKKIVPVIRNDAHKIIEECMLAANVAAAKMLEKAKIPILYRVHAIPDETKMQALRDFLGEFGLSLGGGKKPHPKDFQKVLAMIGDKPERHLIEMAMLRSLKQAQYIEENDGHFGLAYSAYTHFTSPIRRYPDLLVHRALVHLMDHIQVDTFTYKKEDMNRLGKHCSVTERRADEATREVVAWLKCEYMQDKIGQVFKGRISAVTGFGLFVELNDIYVEGLVHVTALKNDYYTFEAMKHRLVGTRGGLVYRLGDPITVLVARVDLDERKIDFDLVDENS